MPERTIVRPSAALLVGGAFVLAAGLPLMLLVNPKDAGVFLVVLGVVATVLGTVCTLLGLYRLATNVDIAARSGAFALDTARAAQGPVAPGDGRG